MCLSWIKADTASWIARCRLSGHGRGRRHPGHGSFAWSLAPWRAAYREKQIRMTAWASLSRPWRPLRHFGPTCVVTRAHGALDRVCRAAGTDAPGHQIGGIENAQGRKPLFLRRVVHGAPAHVIKYPHGRSLRPKSGYVQLPSGVSTRGNAHESRCGTTFTQSPTNPRQV